MGVPCLLTYALSSRELGENLSSVASVLRLRGGGTCLLYTFDYIYLYGYVPRAINYKHFQGNAIKCISSLAFIFCHRRTHLSYLFIYIYIYVTVKLSQPRCTVYSLITSGYEHSEQSPRPYMAQTSPTSPLMDRRI